MFGARDPFVLEVDSGGCVCGLELEDALIEGAVSEIRSPGFEARGHFVEAFFEREVHGSCLPKGLQNVCQMFGIKGLMTVKRFNKSHHYTEKKA